MQYNSYRFRPSALHNIMSGFDKPALTTVQDNRLKELMSKIQLTEKQAIERDDLIRKQNEGPRLSAGAITYVRTLVRQDYLGYSEELDLRQIDKGLTLEDEAIQELNRNTFSSYEKYPSGMYQNEYLVSIGCDIKHHRITRDIKCSWSKKTHPLTKDEAFSSAYFWQGHAYMWLFDTDEHHIDHILLSTPDELRGYDSEQLHDCDDLTWEQRYTTWSVKRDEFLIRQIICAVELARIEMNNYHNQITSK